MKSKKEFLSQGVFTCEVEVSQAQDNMVCSTFPNPAKRFEEMKSECACWYDDFLDPIIASKAHKCAVDAYNDIIKTAKLFGEEVDEEAAEDEIEALEEVNKDEIYALSHSEIISLLSAEEVSAYKEFMWERYCDYTERGLSDGQTEA